ncbi:hypothetical protein E2562_011248 [Oryza meyeriana var. granulata]|uniref:HMA domain-containing protein n=1 Tax=Oryza meyeriana var. granulata TaxID=110450 RepID=A0A6G1BVX7_9ORYZ|nr:hypothetical protein E2562_011248 [Oryza meyeriana var. granulata]
MKIVLKVPITCKKCKSCILQIVSKTKGIKSLTFDDEKSTLTVIGEVDVVVIVDKLRHPKGGKGKEKEGYMVEVMSQCAELQNCCRACRPYYIVDDQPGYSCTIV